MGIKNRIKFSFFITMVLVICISILSISMLYQVQKNTRVKDKISQIVLLQERMNEAVEAQDHTTNIKELNALKSNFDIYEKTFEKLREELPLNQNFSILSSFFKEKEKHIKIIQQLEKLFENEHTIEVAFAQMYKLQDKYIKYDDNFHALYPVENDIRKDIEKDIEKIHNYETASLFGKVQYYSKETLYQHSDNITFDKWEKAVNQLQEQTTIPYIKEYSEVVENIGTIAIARSETTTAKIALQNKVNIVLKDNKQIGMTVSQLIEELSSKTTSSAFLLLLFLTISIVVFLLYFSYKVSKNVSLSVDEIETKIEEGLIEITNLNDEISDTQKEVIFTMGAIGEQRSKETGNHVKRVAEYSKILALHYGLSTEEAEMLKQVSPMHDIGKVAIPDSILNKPGRFEPHEREIMETHANLGFEMLKKSKRPLLKTASIVANEHHEKWDGSGYPKGLSGRDIHIYGRITALADVFDALGSDRVYKKAWDNEKIFKLFKEERGKHFEPKLIDIFFDNLDEFLAVQKTFKDV